MIEAYIYKEIKPIFKDYFRCLSSLKLRYEAVPKDCSDDPDQFFSEVNEKMGFAEEHLKLSTENSLPNPSMRAYVKDYMNIILGESIFTSPLCTFQALALSGKFGQNLQKPMQLIIKSDEELADVIYDPDLELKHAFLVDRETIQVTVEKKNQTLPPNLNANCVIAGKITAMARIELDKLLRYLLLRGCEPLYCDTDSAIFIKPKHVALTGLDIHQSVIGALKDEIGTDRRIGVFCGISAKTYSLDICPAESDQVVERQCKVKGFSLNSHLLKPKMNASVMRTFVSALQKKSSHQMTFEQHQMKIEGRTKKIKNIKMEKTLATTCFNKRFLRPDVSNTRTFAWGVTDFSAASHPLSDMLFSGSFSC